MRYSVKYFFAILLMFVAPQAVQASQDPTQISFAVVPQQTATDMASLWGPVLQFISEKTGYSIRFQASRNMPIFEERLNRGEFDIAYMNPYQYISIRNNKDHSYEVFAKEKDRKLKGIIVVHTNSPYQTIEELNGQSVAFPGPTAFAATLLPMAYMAKKKLSIQPSYVLSHESAYLAVAKGIYQAGGGVEQTFEALPIDVRKRLRILWTSAPFTPHAIVAHPRMQKDVLAKIASVLFEMDQDPKGRELLKVLKFKGITSAKDYEYQDVRAISDLIKPDLTTPQ